MPRKFVYNDSFDPERQIRLLTLLPARKLSCTVECILETTLIDPIPHYEALSYVWGDENVTKPIIVDDCEFQATENLECALRYIRDNREPRVLWVDALCIDQDNAHQKNHQVMRMGQIYAKASNVVIWLGAPDETTALAYSTLKRLALAHETLNYVWNRGGGQGSHSDAVFVRKCLRGSARASFSTYARKICRQPPPILRYDQVYPEQFLGKKATDALVRLCQRAWWKRLWVKQECMLSQSFSLVCGRSVLATETASKAFFSFYVLVQMAPLDVYHEDFYYRDVNITPLNSLFQFRLSGVEASPKGGLLSVLDSVKGDCDDPRDKIFAILSLADDELIAMNPPDYGADFQYVYSRLAKTWIESKKNLDILNCCLHLASSGPSSELPSWVPDWRVRHDYLSLIDKSFSTSCRVFNASLDSSVDYKISAKGRESEILTLGGFCLDVIEELGDSSIDILESDHKWPSPVIQDWQRLALKISADPAGFWLTCVEELGWSTRLGPQERQDFEHEIRDWISSTRAGWPTYRSQSLASSFRYRLRFFLSSNKRIGMCPEFAQVGDLICIFFGGQTPFVLRKREPEGYILLGECYVYGEMDGEAMTRYESGEYAMEEFDLY